MSENRKKITYSTREFFVKGMRGHSAVDEITLVNGDIYLIKRTEGRPELKILIADIYIAGEADILEITEEHSDLDCIVLVGFYNRYSSYAKDLAMSRDIGLFDNREFFGAIHRSGSAFLNYVKKEKYEN